jgi:hypothetical protein
MKTPRPLHTLAAASLLAFLGSAAHAIILPPTDDTSGTKTNPPATPKVRRWHFAGHRRKSAITRAARHPRTALSGRVDVQYLSGGDSEEDVLAEFPDLERDDLLACFEFARQALAARSQHLVLT